MDFKNKSPFGRQEVSCEDITGGNIPGGGREVTLAWCRRVARWVELGSHRESEGAVAGWVRVNREGGLARPGHVQDFDLPLWGWGASGVFREVRDLVYAQNTAPPLLCWGSRCLKARGRRRPTAGTAVLNQRLRPGRVGGSPGFPVTLKGEAGHRADRPDVGCTTGRRKKSGSPSWIATIELICTHASPVLSEDRPKLWFRCFWCRLTPSV